MVYSTISPDRLHHCYACHASASRKTVAEANRDKHINACASARHVNTNTGGQPHTVTAIADTNRNTHLNPAYGNSHANVDGQPHALTIGPSTNQNSDAYAVCGNASSYINPSAKHRKRKPNDTGPLPLPLCSYWYGST